eukprot:CAMPEP_0172519490 /NCGR_PEP_ID=MMETSP1066-20121228/291449_1 /TAXON_ID=671091 /ORGANISM="Coscinodiscus wailesii, Strain CCMP2513" /LENGTH=770 /DNA_ID=CAMNT_0013302089 /DNA_START=225 /DNA_END=2537 /DNA_ORIENTATION=+
MNELKHTIVHHRHVSSIVTIDTTDAPFNEEAETYAICNGLSNQILGHASILANAIDRGISVRMPNAYIFNGAQTINKEGKMEDIAPNVHNSIPIERVFNIKHLRKLLWSRNEGTNIQIVPIDGKATCDGWLDRLRTPNPDTLRLILNNFGASELVNETIEDIVNNVMKKIGTEADYKNGVCVHHRDGKDWHDHCNSWENERNGHNCREREGRSLGSLVKSRILDDSKLQTKLLFYVGDHEPPKDLATDYGFTVFSRSDFGITEEKEIVEKFLGIKVDYSSDRNEYRTLYRDIFAVIDFFICAKMKSFVGNSVSTFSALQISKRNGYASWYNSRFIPLSDFAPFSVPIVYTYTEGSDVKGKIMLQASIMSVRKRLGDHQPIHILYHGDKKAKTGRQYKDCDFVQWLKHRNVVLHSHDPKWIYMVEQYRLREGDPLKSHLFAHAGNFIGTWQRIDIPDFLECEYVLYLDADTVVHKPFSMADFTSMITDTIAFAIEEENSEIPWNAGVALMNVPHMRETKKYFFQYMRRVMYSNGKKEFPTVADQGAYVGFYHLDKLQTKFNVKPYYNHYDKDMKILHFQGPKPNEILEYLAGKQPTPLMGQIFEKMDKQHGTNNLCFSIKTWSDALVEEPHLVREYCESAFSDDLVMMATCNQILISSPKLQTGECQKEIERIMAASEGVTKEELLLSKRMHEEKASKLDDSCASLSKLEDSVPPFPTSYVLMLVSMNVLTAVMLRLKWMQCNKGGQEYLSKKKGMSQMRKNSPSLFLKEL